MNSREKDEKFQRGILHFNAQEFFEAHEVWEEVWLVEAEPEKTFLQGIIQIAAAFHHYGRENSDGAESCRRNRQIVTISSGSPRS
jgi:predicted metal-dependent hydrolase